MTGFAPNALRWTLGIGAGPGGTIFLELDGDRFVEGQTDPQRRGETPRAD